MPFINGIGAPELIIILIIALIVVGPGRLPDVGSALGKSIREFRKASTDLGDSMKVDTSPLPPETPDAPPAPATTAPAVAPQGAALPDAPAAPTSPSTAASRPSEPTPGTN
jgi:TatA/E family protein of Tat protein translocase